MKKQKIILVEDDLIDRESVIRLFGKNNIQSELIFAMDGLEAIDVVHKYANNLNDILNPLIILDINLPKLNGLEVLKEIRKQEHLKLVPVVMLTTSERDADKTESLKLGACKYLTKPLEFNEIKEYIYQGNARE